MADTLELTDSQKQALQSLAARCKGIKYVYGAKVADMRVEPEQIKAIDCSGYVKYLYNKVGIDITDGSAGQYADSVPMGVPEIGDLAFKTENGAIHHVGMVISVLGEAVLITEASGSLGEVVIRTLEEFKVFPDYAQYAGIQRLLLDKVKAI